MGYFPVFHKYRTAHYHTLTYIMISAVLSYPLASGCFQNIWSKHGDNAYKLQTPSEITSRGKHFQEKGNLDISYGTCFCCSQMWRRAVCLCPQGSSAVWRLTVWPVSGMQCFSGSNQLNECPSGPILSQLRFVHLSSARQDGRFFFAVFASSRPGQTAPTQTASAACPACAGLLLQTSTAPSLQNESHTTGWLFFFCCCINLVILLFIQLFGKHKNGCFKCPKARSKPCVA